LRIGIDHHHTHTLSPCLSVPVLFLLIGVGLIGHKIIATHHEVALHEQALEQTKELWSKEFGSEYLYCRKQSPPVPPYFHDSMFDPFIEQRGDRCTFHGATLDRLVDYELPSDWSNPFGYVAGFRLQIESTAC
jgi:hypothetical protein